LYGCKMCAPAAGFETVPRSFRRRQADQSSSRSPSRPKHRLMPGFRASPRVTDNTSSQAAFGSSRTSQPDSMLGSSTPGSRALDWTAPPTALTRCDGRKRPKSTGRRGTCERFSCCLGTQSSKAPSVISASRLTTRSAFPSKSSCELRRRDRGPVPVRSGAATLLARWFPRGRHRPLASTRPPITIAAPNREVGWKAVIPDLPGR
jgi:hypothetical protein